MGGGTSSHRKSDTPLVQRQPCETQTSYRIRVKFQQDKVTKTPWYQEIEHAFGPQPHTIESAIEVFHKQLNTNVKVELLKTYYGMQETELTIKHISHIFGDLSYNPSVGAIYAALLKEREALTDQIWTEFLLDFQGYSENMLPAVNEEVSKFSRQKGLPRTAAQFSDFLLGPANSAFHPTVSRIQRFDRPISEYFIRVGKVPDINDCGSPLEAVSKLAETICQGARVVELHCSGRASDGQPRVFSDIYPEDYPPNSLPLFRDAIQAFSDKLAKTYCDNNEMTSTECNSTHTTLGVMPLLLVLTIDASCDNQLQELMCEDLRNVFGDRLNCPPLNADGNIWSPIQLSNKVVVIAPTSIQIEPVGEEEPTSDSFVPVSPALSELAHFRMVTVYEIRPILDQAKSRTELRKLLQDIVLTLNSAELCAHIMELSSITDMLLVHVQTIKRKIMREKQGNLLCKGGGADSDAAVDQDTRHIVQFSELRPSDSHAYEARFDNSAPVMEEHQEEVEPLRGWRYGAQMVPVDHFSHTEASLQNMSLFQQQGGHGFVPRLPRTLFASFPSYVDLYQDFPTEYARSLFVTILSACRIPRGLEVTQPFIRVYCNNGTGLKQVAITSTVEDNGYNCIWEEDFEFKFHVNDLNAAACMLFVANDRDKANGGELAFASVPLWGLQTGYRSLQLYDMHGTIVPNAVLFAHFDWEPEE